MTLTFPEKNSTFHFRMCLYLVTCFMRVTVSLLCLLQAVSQIYVPIYPDLISEERRIVRTCDWRSNDNLNLMKHATKMDGRIFQKISDSKIKIGRVNSICITTRPFAVH